MAAFKLKDRRTFRVFMSSPFNGLEKERETLTKFYWPQLETLLATRGISLRLVDLRWGITQSSAVDSQTINICLREVDRSDIFVGLYAQRYGWNGLEDKSLQENFEKAKGKYPWIDNHRDKSVTELEYLQAFLNNPNTTPCCFCFRNKNYDEQMIKEAREEDNKKKERGYLSENGEAVEKLDSLKKRVLLREADTLGVLNEYHQPQEAVEFIYNTVHAFVKEKIISAVSDPPSRRAKSSLAHDIYIHSRDGAYVGGKKYFDALDKYLNTDETSHPIIVTGETGSGKSALIANWISKLTTIKEDRILFYHIVGAEPESVTPINLLLRLIENLHQQLNNEEFDRTSVKSKEKELLPKLQDLFKSLDSEENKNGRKLIIIVDKLDQMNTGKTSKPLFWLPKVLSKRMKVIITLTRGSEGAEELLEMLEEDYKSQTLSVDLLSNEEKFELCKTLLEKNSKSFEDKQLDMIISSTKTNQPFFLTVLINELCISGHFRTLDQQIEQLLQAEGVTGLLIFLVKRIEEDFKQSTPEGDLVKQLLCAMALSRKGIAESEIPLPQHIWAPLVYTLDKYLINRAGLLSFAFPEMLTAVEKVYLNSKEKIEKSSLKVADIFFSEYKNCVKNKIPLKKRAVLELCHLLKKAKAKRTLTEILSNIYVFNILEETSSYELLEYWNFVNVPSDELARRLLKSLDSATAEKYSRILRNYNSDSLPALMNWKAGCIDNLRIWMESVKFYHGLDLVFQRQISVYENRPGFTDLQRKHHLVQVKYFQACFFSDTENYRKALALHMEVLEGRKDMVNQELMAKDDLGMSYHGIGLCHYNLKNYEESMKWYKKALEAQNKENNKNFRSNAATYCNIGLILMTEGKYEVAIEHFIKSTALWEKVMPDKLSLDIAYNFHNNALALRRQKDYDGAEKLYLKSLKIKQKLLGQVSYDVALTYMNLGTVETYRKNNETSLEYNKKALEIFKKLAPEGSYRTMMAQENVVNQLTLLGKYEEAEPLFQEVLKFLKSMQGGSSNGLAPLHRRFIKWYDKRGEKLKALDVSNGLVKCSKRKISDIVSHLYLYHTSPKDMRGECVHEGTFEFGMEISPDDKDILAMKLRCMYEEDEKSIVPFATMFCKRNSESTSTKVFSSVADILMLDLGARSLALELLDKAIHDYPENLELQKTYGKYDHEVIINSGPNSLEKLQV